MKIDVKFQCSWFFLVMLCFSPDSLHAGSSRFSIEEVISVCHSLQRIAEHAHCTVEIGDFFHRVVIPRLLGLSLQAALHRKDFTTCLSEPRCI